MKYLKDYLGHTILSSIDTKSSSWGRVGYSDEMNEGISMVGELGSKKIVVDFDQDSENDVVKLNPPTSLSTVSKKGGNTASETVPVFRGFKLERSSGDLREFMKTVKQWGAVNPEELKSLIDLTYPEELRRQQVKVLFITGSSDPLAAQIAETIRDLYYPKCRIIDVLKKYYGADVRDIVNWDAYAQADERTQAMIDTYLAGFLRRDNGRLPARKEFEGYIKKSTGLQSGARRLLNPGHTVDDYIMNSIINAEVQWKKEYGPGSGMPIGAGLKARPAYLFVDDTIIGGTTIRGIFKDMMDAINSNKVSDDSMKAMVKRSIYGYCMFSYKD